MRSTSMVIASDHAGFSLKQTLISKMHDLDLEVEDLGPDSEAGTDYPIYAAKVCEHVLEAGGLGVLVCGSGLGMSMTANRFSGIRAALCANEHMARMARKHNNANVLCLGSRILGADLALSILEAFLEGEFEAGRHQRRVELIESVIADSDQERPHGDTAAQSGP